MSETTDTLQLRAIEKIDFGPDFNPIDAEVDATELSLLLSTLSRSAEACADILEVGELQQLTSWQAGSALQLTRSSEGYTYEKLAGVTGWEDLESDELCHSMLSGGLLCQSRAGMLSSMCRQPDLLWFGIRDFQSSQWEEHLSAGTVDSETLHQAIKLTLQLDVLFKGHDCPRGQMRLDYANASLWSWANASDDYLMALSSSKLTAKGRAALIRAGQGFMIL